MVLERVQESLHLLHARTHADAASSPLVCIHMSMYACNNCFVSGRVPIWESPLSPDPQCCVGRQYVVELPGICFN
jgi:hypothetical protein